LLGEVSDADVLSEVSVRGVSIQLANGFALQDVCRQAWKALRCLPRSCDISGFVDDDEFEEALGFSGE
jgi:hypothetical protein